MFPGHVKILLVEDNRGDARLLQELLKEEAQMSWEMSHVTRLSEAIERLRSDSFDIILLDITLPDAEGIDTVRWIRGAASRVPIVVLTGKNDETFGVNALREGAQDYLIKGEIDTPLLVRSLRYAAERFALELQLRHSQKMEAVGNLAAGIAHDFNNILSIVFGHVDMAASESTEPEVRRSLDEIHRATERAGNLVQQLLILGRKEILHPERTDLGQLAADVVAGVPTPQEKGPFTLEMRPPGAPIPIRGDRGMLERVLLNLILNARDAVQPGGRVEVSAFAEEITETMARKNPEARPGRFGCVQVLDNGAGIEPETLSRIFEPFFTTKKTGKGSGLGLAAVYSIVAQHQGWIEVDSAVGEGTTFRVYLPLDSGESGGFFSPARE